MDASKTQHILFVCTGNTCRSPMAEHLFRRLCAEQRVAGVTCASAGLAATPGVPITPQARYALWVHGITPEPEHLSQPVTPDLVARAGLVIGMTRRHVNQLKARFPAAAAKCRTLMGLVARDADIADPYGLDSEVYLRCLQTMEPALKHLACEAGKEQRAPK